MHLSHVRETKQDNQTSCTLKFREAKECSGDLEGERVEQEGIRKGGRGKR